MSVRARQITARVLVVATSLVLVLALIAGYVRLAAVNSDQFANRATAALRDDSVRSLVAEKITDDVVLEKQRDLLAARPIIQSVAASIVGSRAFTDLFHAGVRDVHRAIFDRDQDTVTLSVADVGTVMASALRVVRPSLAADVESTGGVELLKRDIGSASGNAARVGDDIKSLALLLLIVTLLLMAGALAVSPDRRRTVVDLGIGAATGGVLLVVVYAVVRSRAVGHVETPEGQAAAGAVWDAFLGDLHTAAWILAGAGAVTAAAAASLIKPVDIRQPLRRVAGWVTTEPSRPAAQALRGVGFLSAGLLLLIARDAVFHLLVTLTGVFLIYEGASVLLRLIYRAPPEAAEAAPRGPGFVHRARRPLAVSAAAAGVIVATIAIFVGSGGTSTAAPPDGACNGHEELCDRRFDQVVLPATHNAMSVPLPGWYSSEQEAPIADQLAGGVRGLLVDTHYADLLRNGRLRTYFGSREKLLRQAKQDGVSPGGLDAAMRLRDRLGFAGEGKRGMYLCHTFCELGGTSLGSVLDDIHDFLVSNPDEILVVINQDYVTPKDFVAAVNDAGLGDLVYRGPTTGEWPTLREMIDDDQRVVFLAENHAGAAPWYQLAYKSITEETPYTFPKVADLTDPAKLPASCEPNRGPPRAPLFLINHWISTDPAPRPSDATKVNAYAPLLRRARECQRIRDHLPNLLAINFYREGDVFKVVDTLNGVR